VFDRSPRIGLDIGAMGIRIVRVKKKKTAWQLISHGSIKLRTEAVEYGGNFNSEIAGKELGALVRDLNLKGKPVVAALSNQHVYIRNLIMPRMNFNEMKEAVHYQAMSFLPIPVEEAAIDIFPWRNFEDGEGRKTELLFLAVRRQEVENIRLICRLAGLKLIAVDIEPLAINRVLDRMPNSIDALIKLSSNKSCMTIFKLGIPVFNRFLLFNTPDPNLDSFIYSEFEDQETKKNDKRRDSQHDCLQRAFISEVKRSVEYYEMQDHLGAEGIERFFLYGESSTIEGINKKLEKELGREVSVASFAPQLIFPPGIDYERQIQIKYEYTVALGLAVRAAL